MQEFVNHVKDCGLKTSSIRKYLVPLRNATAYGTERQLLLVDPLVNYKYAPKRKNKDSNTTKRKAYSKEECQSLMNAIVKEPNSPIAVPVMLALHLGFGREEILGLRWSDVNMEKRIVTVQNTITKVYAIVTEPTDRATYFLQELGYFPLKDDDDE